MSKRNRTVHACRECGFEAPRWLGRCGGCGAWNTLDEVKGSAASGHTRGRGGEPGRVAVPLSEVRSDEARRLPTGIAELDRVLGGGPVAGGVCLLGGDPGIGKSTLLMQMLAALADHGAAALYVSGEESSSQVAMRGERLGQSGMASIDVLPTTTLTDVETALSRKRYQVVVVDSIQTVRDPELTSAAGTVSQLREVSARLIDRAKTDNIALFLIGHVTKEGMLAGPKVLEHLVDTVLSFEGDPTGGFRLVRATKNRFGPAYEVAVFEMHPTGLAEVTDPSALFLAERPQNAAGSVVVPTAEGSRPLLVEIQALVSPAVYGSARRVASGIDPSRLSILLAVLERRAGVQVLDRDVFASVAGGARVAERATDLAVALAVTSSLRDRPVGAEVAVFGELGLAGEVRAVGRPAARLAEAQKLGFRRVVMSAADASRLRGQRFGNVEPVPVSNLTEALEASLDQ